MIDRTDLDLRYADHVRRVARVSREGWMRTRAEPTGGIFGWAHGAIAAAMPLGVGGTLVWSGGKLVRVGERLRRMPVDHAFDPGPQ